MKNSILFFVLVFHSIIVKSNSLDSTTNLKKLEVLKKICNIIENKANANLIIAKLSYKAYVDLKNNNQIIISELTDGASPKLYIINFLKLEINKNIKITKYNQKAFSIKFSKSICKKLKSSRSKKFEIFFEFSKNENTIIDTVINDLNTLIKQYNDLLLS